MTDPHFLNHPSRICRDCGTPSLRGCTPPDLEGLTDDQRDYLSGLRPEGWRRCASCSTVIHVDTLPPLAAGAEA